MKPVQIKTGPTETFERGLGGGRGGGELTEDILLVAVFSRYELMLAS